MEVSTGGLPGLTMRGWDQIEGFLNRLGPAANTLNGASESVFEKINGRAGRGVAAAGLRVGRGRVVGSWC
jgi:hypothetical protein